jgi:tetratricopeptide (TPR) repeat protein
MAQDIKDNDLQVKVFRWMGEAYLKVGKHEPARKVFLTALERAEAGQIDDMKVAVYIGLFKLLWFNLKQNITQTLVKQALDTAKRIQDRVLQADLFDALAYAYTRLADTDIALGYGQTAFAYWNSLKNHSGIGRTAYTNAAIYMQIGQLKDDKRFLTQAMSFLEIARDELAHTDDKWQYPLLAYEQASIYFQLEEFEEAASWYRQSLSEAEQMNSPHYVVIAQHGLGLALSKLKQFSSARRLLYLAFNHWDDLNHSYEKASLLAGLADLELRDNKQNRARIYVDEGLKYTEDVQDDKLRQFLRDQFEDIISQLPPL